MRLFEAARWAPSSFNAQQWRALYARRGTEHWQTFFDLLVDANKAWAKNAVVLVVFISRKNFDYDEELSVTHSYDCGAAWENLHCKAFSRVSSCMGWKDSITIAPVKSCGFLTTFKSKRWPPSAGRVRKNCFLRNYEPAKVLMTGESFLTAFSKDRFGLANRQRANNAAFLAVQSFAAIAVSFHPARPARMKWKPTHPLV
jgi:nitroreductase